MMDATERRANPASARPIDRDGLVPTRCRSEVLTEVTGADGSPTRGSSGIIFCVYSQRRGNAPSLQLASATTLSPLRTALSPTIPTVGGCLFDSQRHSNPISMAGARHCIICPGFGVALTVATTLGARTPSGWETGKVPSVATR